MTCSCSKYEVCGQPCSHQISVAKLVCEAIGVEFKGFTHHDVALRYWSAFMHLAYKDTTPSNIQNIFHELCKNEVSGPKLRHPIDECIPVEEPSPLLPAIERLKNYDTANIDLSLVDGMYHTTFTPEIQDESNENISEQFLEMFNQIQDGISESTQTVFSESIDNHSFAADHSVGAGNSRQKMKGMMNTVYDLADRVGDEAVAKLEAAMNDFITWSSAQLEIVDGHKNKKRKYVTLPQNSYQGSCKRVYNTHNMR